LGSTVKPRGLWPTAEPEDDDDDCEDPSGPEIWERTKNLVDDLSERIRGLRAAVMRIQRVVERTVDFVDPTHEEQLARPLYSKSGAPRPIDRDDTYDDLYDDDDDDDGPDDARGEKPVKASESQ